MKKNYVFLTEEEFEQYKDGSVCFGTFYDKDLVDCKTCCDKEKCSNLTGGAIGRLFDEATVEEAFDDKPSELPYDKNSFLSLHGEYEERYRLDVEKLKIISKVFFPMKNNATDAKDFVHVLDVSNKGIVFTETSILGSIGFEDILESLTTDTKGYPIIKFEDSTIDIVRPILEAYYEALKNRYSGVVESVAGKDLDVELEEFIKLYKKNREEESALLSIILSSLNR